MGRAVQGRALQGRALRGREWSGPYGEALWGGPYVGRACRGRCRERAGLRAGQTVPLKRAQTALPPRSRWSQPQHWL
ncbi:hypothetical protein Sros_7295 [Streptosporangium roseum DSM 43021]|uniref:Uncharacterized protein n=1 Tax=Streptosporangium roseum (strain ATCC 12428 / DSM 43021 / JCM 3005 / KCTC 9067 / NCIMB 10171 / NRRL 2505 / NI 9100) TaxID=479432 RepID=D2BCF3_STRRD|nr:hypothetical protein Sros_7295 [Streptosporangium roseum DSM 43021]